MQFSFILQYLQDNDLFLKQNEWKDIPVHAKLECVGIDILERDIFENSLKYGIKNNQLNDPTTFFDSFITSIIRNTETNFGIECEYQDLKLDHANWRPEKKSNYMLTGSGDGRTRYITMVVAKNLPQFYFHIDPQSLKNQIKRAKHDQKRWHMEKEKFFRQGTDEEKKFLTEYQTYESVKKTLPVGHRSYYSIKHTVRQAIRHRNGIHLLSHEERDQKINLYCQEHPHEDYPMTDSEDEWDIQENAKKQIREEKKWEKEKQFYLQNGSELEKQLVTLPKETLLHMMNGDDGYFIETSPKQIIPYLIKHNLTDPNNIIQKKPLLVEFVLSDGGSDEDDNK